MKNHTIIEGFWFIKGKDEPALFGVLTVDSHKGLTLEVKEKPNLSEGDGFWACLNHKLSNNLITIQGYDKNAKPIRLFDCIEEEMDVSAGLKVSRFSVLRAVTGLDDGEWSQISCAKVRFRFSLFDCWMNPAQCVSETFRTNINYEVSGLGKMTIVTVSTTSQNVGLSEAWWLELELQSERPISFIDLHLKHELASLLTLLTNVHVIPDELAFSASKLENSWLDFNCIFQANGDDGTIRRTQLPVYMRTTHSALVDSFGTIVSNWFQLSRDHDFKEVLRLYAVARTQPLPVSVRFLLVAQALEAYHTASKKFSSTKSTKAELKLLMERVREALLPEDLILVRGCLAHINGKSFLEKLNEIIETSPTQFKRVVEDVISFARAVRDNRNVHTHHVGSSTNKKKLNSFQLAGLEDQAMCLLEMLLLRDIGAPEFAIDHVLQEYKSIVRIEFNADDE